VLARHGLDVAGLVAQLRAAVRPHAFR
jgi:hypothetical protein